jgi:hypothetical protein
VSDFTLCLPQGPSPMGARASVVPGLPGPPASSGGFTYRGDTKVEPNFAMTVTKNFDTGGGGEGDGAQGDARKCPSCPGGCFGGDDMRHTDVFYRTTKGVGWGKWVGMYEATVRLTSKVRTIQCSE